MHLALLSNDGYAMMSLAITFIVDTMSPLAIAFIINKSLNLSMAQFPHLLNEHNDNCFLPSLGVAVKINELAFTMYCVLLKRETMHKQKQNKIKPSLLLSNK